MKYKYLLSFLAITFLATTVYSQVAEASFREKFRSTFRKNKQAKIDQRLANTVIPTDADGRPVLDGRCYPTCVKDICSSRFPVNSLWDSLNWCKSNCANSRQAGAGVNHPDYPNNVCSNLPPFDDDQEGWEGERSNFASGEMRHGEYEKRRKAILKGPLALKARAGEAVHRVKEGGLKAFNCDFCKDSSQVCENPISKADIRYMKRARICIDHCWNAKFIRDPRIYDPQIGDDLESNLKENMKVYLKGLCDGRTSQLANPMSGGQLPQLKSTGRRAEMMGEDQTPTREFTKDPSARTRRKTVQRVQLPMPQTGYGRGNQSSRLPPVPSRQGREQQYPQYTQ